MSFEFRPAVRENVGLLIGLIGPSGGGKTRSAMRLAAGIAAGRPFCVIDTEARRALHYADDFKFDHGELGPPFRPERYADAIRAADQAGYPVIVVDSASHEHAGEGGLLDWHDEILTRLAGDDWKKREAMNMVAWVEPKMAHKRMVQRLLQLRAHLILCFRAEEKVRIVKDANNRTRIEPAGWQPVCEKNLPYELTASFLLTPDRPGIPQPIKLQEQHRALFPLDQPVSEESGRRLAEWARGGAKREADPRAGVLRDIAATLQQWFPSQSAADKAARSRVIESVFKQSGWKGVEALDLEVLQAAVSKADLTTPSRLETACADHKAATAGAA